MVGVGMLFAGYFLTLGLLILDYLISRFWDFWVLLGLSVCCILL